MKGAIVGVALAFVLHLFFTYPGSSDSHRPVVEILTTQHDDQQQGSDAPLSYADAVTKATPAVVNIYTSKVVIQQRSRLFDDPIFQRFFGDRLKSVPRKRLESSLGSGVIISNQGYVLTNNHVIEGADEIQVALNDGRTTQAQVVGTDPETDIAVLFIKLDELPKILISKTETLRVGDVVLAIGNPFGVGQTVTQGIISATGRNQLGISTFENFVQTDAAINPGNSGGALVNAYGELIGINTAIFSRSGGSQGIGFAIPMSIAINTMQQIIEYGHAVRGWLGIEAQTLEPALAESFGLGNIAGVVVAGVLRNGPADQAGLEPGDVITHINKQPVSRAKEAMGLIATIA
ncbi:MAG: trypsin-like serine protease, partial [Gammaproteobacteria bacterium]|nr:trypsin-like serine protease [Gammaproteobacteria bacterium]